MSKSILLLVFYCLFINSLFAQDIEYNVDLTEPWKNTYNIELVLKYNKAPDSVVLKMATWTPGSYLIREFSKHVNLYRAESKNGKELKSFKKDKNTWIIKNSGEKEIHFKYSVYAHELSVRTSFLNSDMGLINGTSVFIYPENRISSSSVLNFKIPESWRISTTLEKNNKGNLFTANNYDQLFDCPIFLGTHDEFEFEAAGVKHRFAINGPTFYDEESLKEDIGIIVENQTKIFGQNPNKEYLFITITHENGGGGLEHKNSTTLIIDRFRLTTESSYRRFLSLVAHEYFHLWNVKRIRPESLGPFDYEKENYTDLLWMMEGFTTYYGSKTLVRSEHSSESGFLSRIANSFEREYEKPGGKVQSLVESSLDAWIKYYRDNENDYNATVSYYGRGYLMAALLDMQIIRDTEGDKSLDDLMRYMYEEYAIRLNRGFTLSELILSMKNLTGESYEQFFENHIRGTKFPKLESIMSPFGFEINSEIGIKDEWGLSIENKDEHYYVRRVTDGSTARESGINVGDELIAIEEYQFEPGKLSFFSSVYPDSTTLKFTILRDGLLKEIMVLTPHIEEKSLNIRVKSEIDEKTELYRRKLMYGN